MGAEDMSSWKCRVWNTLTKTWYPYQVLNYGFTLDGRFTVDAVIVDADIVEVSRMTGLKDRKGIDIYEGDIIRTALGELACIEYNSNLLAFIAKECGYDKYDFENRGERENDSLEVLGNIYEHPDLLKVPYENT